MSLTRNDSVRCDDCGRLSRHARGEYRRPDGSSGYICSQGQDSEFDYCDECMGNRCPACTSKNIVYTHPSVPGPIGWGGRCKDCRHVWSRFPPAED